MLDDAPKTQSIKQARAQLTLDEGGIHGSKIYIYADYSRTKVGLL
jgi:hypothetical protein